MPRMIASTGSHSPVEFERPEPPLEHLKSGCPRMRMTADFSGRKRVLNKVMTPEV
jgi:hypothetical protein